MKEENSELHIIPKLFGLLFGLFLLILLTTGVVSDVGEISDNLVHVKECQLDLMKIICENKGIDFIEPLRTTYHHVSDTFICTDTNNTDHNFRLTSIDKERCE